MKKSIYAVIDMKAFYSFVECIDRNFDPYKTPLVVADISRSSNTIILSVTPYLKNKGIPSRLRLKDLPKGENYIYATPRMERYLYLSAQAFSIILDFIAKEDIHIYSIDEGFINLSPYLKYYKMTPYELVKKIKDTIKDKTGLDTTIGIGDNMFLAKVALDNYAKSNKDCIYYLKKENIKNELWNISPLTKIWGIGEKIAAKLNYFGIYSVKDLALANLDFLKLKFGIIGEELYNHANGIDNTNIQNKYIPNETSLTNGQVLFNDYTYDETKLIIREECDDLSKRMRDKNKTCGVVSLYIGYSKTGGFAHSMSLLKNTDNNEILYNALLEIYEKYIIKNLTIRRVSICFSKLKDNTDVTQLDLFLDNDEEFKLTKLNKTIDKIQNIYGSNSILRATSLLKHSTIKERHNYIGGHQR